jgi:hypothetical protein
MTVGLAALVVLAWPVVVTAQEADPTVTRVEEDWVLWVYQPNGQAACPQFHTVMSPLPNLDSFYFMATWNYWEQPTFSPGGFQIQSCSGDTVLETNGNDTAELSLFAEVITWTQVMETDGQQLGFTLLNGRSQTWGSFGYPETLIVSEGMVPDLNQYSPEVSAANASITYGRNRVIMLTLDTVRYYGEDGLIRTEDNSRHVYRIFDSQ